MERAEIKAAKVVICGYCEKRIKNPHSNQLFHHGECQRLGNLAKRKDGFAKKRKEIKMVACICECGRTFEKKETNTKRQYCHHPDCTNARQMRIRHERIANGTWKEKKAKPKAKKEDPYKIKFVDIIAKCPKCSTRHIKNVVAGSSKWIYCEDCEGNRNYSPMMAFQQVCTR